MNVSSQNRADSRVLWYCMLSLNVADFSKASFLQCRLKQISSNPPPPLQLFSLFPPCRLLDSRIVTAAGTNKAAFLKYTDRQIESPSLIFISICKSPHTGLLHVTALLHVWIARQKKLGIWINIYFREWINIYKINNNYKKMIIDIKRCSWLRSCTWNSHLHVGH
jgi:hypothetical protein